MTGMAMCLPVSLGDIAVHTRIGNGAYMNVCVCVSVCWISSKLACVDLSRCNPVQSLLSGRRQTEISFSPTLSRQPLCWLKPFTRSLLSSLSLPLAHKDHTDLIRWMDAGKFLLPAHHQLVGRGLHRCCPGSTPSGLKTKWWKSSQKFGRNCGRIGLFPFILYHSRKKCSNMLECFKKACPSV